MCNPPNTLFTLLAAKIAVAAVVEPLPKNLMVDVSVSVEPVDTNFIEVDKLLPVKKKWFIPAAVLIPTRVIVAVDGVCEYDDVSVITAIPCS